MGGRPKSRQISNQSAPTKNSALASASTRLIYRIGGSVILDKSSEFTALNESAGPATPPTMPYGTICLSNERYMTV